MKHTIIRIRSGGQSGVDRAALDFVRCQNIEICGWCPKGGWAEDYPEAPGIRAVYPELQETRHCDRATFEESMDESSGYEYFLLYENDACVGVIGIYSYPEDQNSAWLGWFGIREDFRRKKLGTTALKAFEEMAAARGYLFARLYTDAVNNDVAIAFYQANGYVSEPYQNPQDPACMKYRTVIFSKSLTSRPLELWNNRSIHLTEQIAKQEGNCDDQKS